MPRAMVRRAISGWTEAGLWLLLILLSAMGLSGALVVVGLLAFGVPGIILLLAPNVLLYALLLQPARFAWRATGRWQVGVLVGAVMLALAALPALSVNTRLARMQVADRAGDYDAAAPARPVRTVALVPERASGPDACDTLCRGWLASGRVQAVVVADGPTPDDSRGLVRSGSVFTLGDAAACAAAEGRPDAPKGCLIRSWSAHPAADAIVQLETVFRSQDSDVEVSRVDPGATGRRLVRRLSLWSCMAADACSRVRRLTEISDEPLWPMLTLGQDTLDYGMEFNRAWARGRRTVNAIQPDAVFAALTGGGRPSPPLERAAASDGAPALETRVSLAALDAAVDRAASGVGPWSEGGTLRDMLSRWNAQTALSARQISFLRKLVRTDAVDDIPFNWAKHPDAAAALAADLGPAVTRAGSDKQARRASLLHAVATLPPPALQTLAPQLRALMASPGALDWDGAAITPDLIVRYGELGPASLAPMIETVRPKPNVLERHASSTDMAIVIALCRMGPSARSALRTLREKRSYLASQGAARGAVTLIPAAVARIESSRLPRSSCTDALVGRESDMAVQAEWLTRLRAVDGPHPASP